MCDQFIGCHGSKFTVHWYVSIQSCFLACSDDWYLYPNPVELASQHPFRDKGASGIMIVHMHDY